MGNLKNEVREKYFNNEKTFSKQESNEYALHVK